MLILAAAGPAIPMRLADHPDLAGMIVAVLAAIVVLGSVIAIQWRRVRIGEAEASIKLRMVDKGYSAEEIEGVLGAKLTKRGNGFRSEEAGRRDFVRSTS